MKARTGVYALRFVNGMHYVGQSSDIDSSIGAHASGAVACTASWGSGCVEVQLLTSASVDEAFAERNETLERMQKYGIEKVRGWRFADEVLSEDAVEAIVSLLCEKHDVCADCRGTGHFRGACRPQKTEAGAFLARSEPANGHGLGHESDFLDHECPISDECGE